jgi:hypothetical protein
MTHDDGHTAPHVGHSHTACFVCSGLDHNSAVHFLIRNGPPSAIEPDFGPLIGRAVKSFGERSLDIGGLKARIIDCCGHCAVVGNLREDLAQSIAAIGTNFKQGITGVGSPLADGHVLDLECAPAGGDHIEDLGQDQAVDDVTANLNIFHKRLRRA